jgi:hypothetical protein
MQHIESIIIKPRKTEEICNPNDTDVIILAMNIQQVQQLINELDRHRVQSPNILAFDVQNQYSKALLTALRVVSLQHNGFNSFQNEKIIYPHQQTKPMTRI